MNAGTKRESLVCISCPRGCLLDAERGADGSVSVSGGSCPRGAEYARQELTAPVRVLTALMRLEGAERPVSVRTDRPVPKERLLECAAAIYRIHPKAPVRRGDVLVRDLCGTGCSVIATRDAEEGK